MATKFLFSNCSYLLLMGASPEAVAKISVVGRAQGFRVADIGAGELKAVFAKVTHCVGIFVDRAHIADAEWPEVLAQLQGGSAPWIVFGADNGVPAGHAGPAGTLSDAHALSSYLESHLAGLRHKGVAELVTLSFQYIFPQVIGEAKGVPIAVVENESGPSSFSILINSTSDDWMGQATLKVRLEEVAAKFPLLNAKGEGQIIDAFKELANQFLGVINSNMRQVGLSARIGLPTFVDTRSGQGLVRPPFFATYVRVADPSRAVEVEFGAFALGKTAPTDLTGIKFTQPGREVVFL